MVESGSVIFGGVEDAEIWGIWVDGDILVVRLLLLMAVFPLSDVRALGSYEQNVSRFLERQFAQGSSRSHWLC